MSGYLKKVTPTQVFRFVEIFPKRSIPLATQTVSFGKYDKFGGKEVQPFSPQNFMDFWKNFRDMPAARRSPFFGLMDQWERDWDSLTQPENISNFSKSMGGKLIRMDVDEDKEKYSLKADLPGLSKDDIKINLSNDNILQISGQRTQESKTDGDKRHLIERYYGSFERSIKLTKPVDKNAIKAKVENGVLQVIIPKQQTEQEPDSFQVNVE